MNTRVIAQTKPSATSTPPARTNFLQRKCACGGTPGPTGECEECKRKRSLGLQPKLCINEPGDEFEREADRLAEAVVGGRSAPAVSYSPKGLRRQEKPKVGKSEDDEKYKESLKKLAEAFLQTELGKQIKNKAFEMGAAAVSTVPGAVVTGSLAVGAVAGMAATGAELPFQVPEIPLDVVAPGLKVKITYEGPVNKPTNAAVTFSGTFGEVKESKKPKDAERRDETTRLATEQAKFREGLKTPQQRAAEDEAFWSAYWRMKMTEPLGIPGARLASPLAGVPEKKLEETTVHRKAVGATATTVDPSIVYDVLESPGQPLEATAREFMETRFGHDFSNVRVHADSRANASADAVAASAYTVGSHIVFGAGKYTPETVSGQSLLAHELTHVVQQGAAARSSLKDRLEISLQHDVSEEQTTAGTAPATTQKAATSVFVDTSQLRLQRFSLGLISDIPVLGHLIELGAYLLGFTSFDDDELANYLNGLAETKKIRGGLVGDDQARAVVGRWMDPKTNAKFDLDRGWKVENKGITLSSVEIKALLVKEMLDGSVGGDDQLAIIRIFKRSSEQEIEQLLMPPLGTAIQELQSDFSKENYQTLLSTVRARFPSVGLGHVTVSDTPTDKGECTLERAIIIHTAQKRAEARVNHAISILGAYLERPILFPQAAEKIQCYFTGANAKQVANVRDRFIQLRDRIFPKLFFACPSEPFTGFWTVDPQGKRTEIPPEEDVFAKALQTVAQGDPAAQLFKVALFPDFFELQAEGQPRVVIHEGIHHIVPGDFHHNRPGCKDLNVAQAFINPDSYAYLARDLESVREEGQVQIRFKNCPHDWKATITAATRTAQKWVNNALFKVDALIANPALPDPATRAQLNHKFHIANIAESLPQIREVRQGFMDIQAAFSGELPIECDRECDPRALGEAPGWFFGLYHRAGNLVLCDRWFKDPEMVKEREATIIHEMAHRFAAKGETAYFKWHGEGSGEVGRRKWAVMTPKQALDNADSYAQFARYLFEAQTTTTSPAPVRSNLLQRKCACGDMPGSTGECEECREKRLKLQRKTRNSGLGIQNDFSAPPIVHEALRSSGQPLDVATRAFMEPRFGHDFSQVRVHTDAKAANSARVINASAYTVGDDIVFADSRYNPATPAGRHLLAHELAHTIQQEGASTNNAVRLRFATEDGAEQDANCIVDNIDLDRSTVNGTAVPLGSLVRVATIQRQAADIASQTSNQRPDSTGKLGLPRGVTAGLFALGGLGLAAGGLGIAALAGATVALGPALGILAGGALLGGLLGLLDPFGLSKRTRAIGAIEADVLIRQHFGQYLSRPAGPLHNAKIKPVTQTELKMRWRQRNPSVEPRKNLVGWTDKGPELNPSQAAPQPEPKNAESLEQATPEAPIIYYATDHPDAAVLVHEGLHAYEDRGFELRVRNFVSEGITEFLTKEISSDIRIASESEYEKSEVPVIEKLVARIGREALLQAYFKGDFGAADRVLGENGLEDWAILLQEKNGESDASNEILNRQKKP